MAQTFIPENNLTDKGAFPLDVELKQVYKVYNGETAVSGVNFSIRKGEFFSILGPSGCGKTTTLRLIAGFEVPSAGEVLIKNVTMNDIPAYRRPVNTVFQSYALFRHLTVEENIAFGLNIKKLPKPEVKQRVQQALMNVQMESYAKRFPSQLSGGQQQRVALARALINQPTVVLLDEPLGALDLKLRKEMQVELSKLHQDLGLTFVMVTHDQEEALSLSDRIAVMQGGKIEQIGTPNEIYDYPRTPFVADFIGDTNLFEGHIEESDHSSYKIKTTKGLDLIVQPQGKGNQKIALSTSVVVSVRPEKIKLSLEQPVNQNNCFQGKLGHIMFLGTHTQYIVELKSGNLLTVMQPNTITRLASPNSPVWVYWNASDAIAIEQ
jgi:spermidine/putrescine transport system ATP-binding protein